MILLFIFLIIELFMCLYVDGYAHNIIYMNGLKKNKICALCNIKLTVESRW